MPAGNNNFVDTDAKIKDFLNAVLSSEGIVVDIRRTFINYNGVNRSRVFARRANEMASKGGNEKFVVIALMCYPALQCVSLFQTGTSTVYITLQHHALAAIERNPIPVVSGFSLVASVFRSTFASGCCCWHLRHGLPFRPQREHCLGDFSWNIFPYLCKAWHRTLQMPLFQFLSLGERSKRSWLIFRIMVRPLVGSLRPSTVKKFKSMSMKTAALSCLMARCARSSRKSLILLLQRIG